MTDWELKGKVALLILHLQEDIAGQGGKGEVAEFNPFVPMPAYGAFYDYMRATKPNAPGYEGTQLISELSPVWGEPVVRKWNVGIFSNSNLKEAHEFVLTKFLPLFSLVTTTQRVLSKI